MVITDGTGRSYGRPPGGRLVEGSRNRSRVSRRLSRTSRRLSRVSRRSSRGLEGYRGDLEDYRGSSRVVANANCIGGVRFKGCAKGGRTSIEGGGFEVCSAVACKAAKPTTEL